MMFQYIVNLSPNEFEVFISNLLKGQGYTIKRFAPGEDIGIDIIANKDNYSIAIQVKKYISRKVNLSMVYHTYGATEYYNCNKSVIVSLSELTPKAMKVAKKLNVEIWDKNKIIELTKSIDNMEIKNVTKQIEIPEDWFYNIWNCNIKELKGKRIKHLSRDTYITVVDVDDDGLSIINSNGRTRNFSIDIFRYILTKLKNEGIITREEINNEYQRRGSSTISAIIVTIPGIYKDESIKKTTIVWKK